MKEKNEKGLLANIRNNYILKNIFEYLPQKKVLEIIRYNKYIQNRLDKGINNFKEYLTIEIEVIPKKNRAVKFINISNKSYFHIYFNNNKEEKKVDFIKEQEKIDKIKIKIDKEINSLEGLFKNCDEIEEINFIKFNRKDITNMSYMFYGCSRLKKLDLSFFNTDNVTNMNSMFFFCSSLKELNLNNFNTNKVTDMNSMFSFCSSLKELNLNNFNTDNVIDMEKMFMNANLWKK